MQRSGEDSEEDGAVRGEGGNDRTRDQGKPAEEEEEEEEEEGYHAFKGRQAMGVLYKLPPPMEAEAYTLLQYYVNGGAMDADLRFVREVYGLTNTSGRKDFDLFWESPWAEEHVRNTTRKRKLDAQQRAMAVRTYIRRAAADEKGPKEADFLHTVDRLTEWEERRDDRKDALVKTVSRMVQSFERGAITHLLEVLEQPMCDSMRAACMAHLDPDVYENATTVVCTLRRSSRVFHLFAAAVAAEIVWGDATSGARNTTIYMCKQLDEKRREACMALLRVLARLSVDNELSPDMLGMPLMQINASMCVAKGVLVVMPGGKSATYVLDVIGDDEEEDLGRLERARSIKILRFVPAASTAPS